MELIWFIQTNHVYVCIVEGKDISLLLNLIISDANCSGLSARRVKLRSFIICNNFWYEKLTIEGYTNVCTVLCVKNHLFINQISFIGIHYFIGLLTTEVNRLILLYMPIWIPGELG